MRSWRPWSAGGARPRAPPSRRSRCPAAKAKAKARATKEEGSAPQELDDDPPGAGPVVEVDEHDLLPGAEQQLAAGEGNRDRRPDEGGPHVAVPVGVGVALVVLPAVVLGDEALEGVVEVLVAAGLVLDRRHAAGRMGHEHGAQPVG